MALKLTLNFVSNYFTPRIDFTILLPKMVNDNSVAVANAAIFMNRLASIISNYQAA